MKAGDKQIEEFFADGLIREPADIFTLAARDQASLKKLKDREGYGETSVRNLFAAIDSRRVIGLERVIYALGIRHVGKPQAGCWRGITGHGAAFTMRRSPLRRVMRRRRRN